MHMMQERQSKENRKGHKLKSWAIGFTEDLDESPRSGSETISDERTSPWSDLVAGSRPRASLLEESHVDIIWPTWLDPGGRLSSSVPLVPEFQPFLEEKKRQKQRHMEEIKSQLGDPLQPVDVTMLKRSKGVLCGDGWRRDKEGSRIPNIDWKFLKDEQNPVDPRNLNLLRHHVQLQ